MFKRLLAMFTRDAEPMPDTTPTPAPEQTPQPIEFTREQYMNKECDHDTFYSQFVTDGVKWLVLHHPHIGKERIVASTCPHFNDIPLKHWDSLKDDVRMSISTKKFMRLSWPKYAGNGSVYWSLSDAVCIAKQAARMVRDANKGETK